MRHWTRLQEGKLLQAYEAAVADTRTYPYGDEQEREVLRARRDARQQRTNA